MGALVRKEQIRDLNRALTRDRDCSLATYMSRMDSYIALARKRNDPQILAEIEIAIGCKLAEDGKPLLAFEHFGKGRLFLNLLPPDEQEPWWLSLMYSRSGIAYDDLLDFEQSLLHHLQAYEIDQEAEDVDSQVRDLINIGYTYLQMGVGDEAIYYLSAALKERPYNTDYDSHAYFHMGSAYMIDRHYNQAKDHFDRAIAANSDLNKHFDFTLNALSCSIKRGDIDEARQLLADLAKIWAQPQTNITTQSKVVYWLAQAMLCAVDKAYDQAKVLCEKAQVEAIVAHDYQSEVSADLQIAELYFAQKEFAKSQALLEELLAKPISYYHRFLAQDLLYDLYVESGAWEQACELLKTVNENNLFTRSRLFSLQQLLDSRDHELELAKKNQQLTELNHERDEILHVVVHDLKNPLSGALMLMELLTEDMELITASQLSTYQARAYDTLSSMFAIVSQLTLFADVEHGYKVPIELVDVSQVVSKVVQENSALAASKQQRLIFKENSSSFAEIHGTALWVRQIMSNTISNAIKYSPWGAQTTVTLSNDAVERTVSVEVKDQGEGLSNRDMNELFGKYRRLSAVPTGDETSTGLGLYIAKTLAEKMGGSLVAESEGRGRGSKFTLTLPYLESGEGAS